MIKWLLRFFWIIFVGLGFKNITGNIWTAFSYIVTLYGSFLVLSNLQEWVICNTTEKIAVKKNLKNKNIYMVLFRWNYYILDKKRMSLLLGYFVFHFLFSDICNLRHCLSQLLFIFFDILCFLELIFNRQKI